MIITKLQGGLGNQMFQFAVARSKGRENVYLDFSFLQKNKISSETFSQRGFELGIFKINYKEFTYRLQVVFLKNSLKNRLLRRLFYGQLHKVNQRENEFVDIPNSKNIYLNGYFQSEKYFYDIREILLKEFTFPLLDIDNSKILKKITSCSNSVSIHIRRGDYLNPEILKYHGCLSEEYYYNAINIIEERFKNCYYFIFSDDISYGKSIFSHLKNVEFIDINKGINSWKDMSLMSKCEHHIIANSSFSWWGAWLGRKDGLTIAPKDWFNKEKAIFNIDDIVPERWLSL